MALPVSSAFDLTKEEKEQCKNDILFCLTECATILRRKQPLSLTDCEKAFGVLHNALVLAYDDDVRDSPPWAQSHLLLGHIMRAIRCLPEAEDAYIEAASIISNDSSERAAAKEAAISLFYIEKAKKANRRKGGIWNMYKLQVPSANSRTRGERLRDHLNSPIVWYQEHTVVVPVVATITKKPRIVNPLLRRPAARRVAQVLT